MIEPSQIVDKNMFSQIMKTVPAIYRCSEWKKLYAPSKHGTSLKLLYRKMKNVGSNVVIIRDNKRNVFGAYCSQGWECRNKSTEFYGTGESFLFTFRVSRLFLLLIQQDTQYIRYYPWTKKNYYFMFSNNDGLAMGAG